MADEPNHKAAFIELVSKDRSAANYMAGYIAGSVPDKLLCDAMQSWRAHEAALADLEAAPEAGSASAGFDEMY